MGQESTASIVTAIVGLVGLFFGLGFWGIMRSLVANQTTEINDLRKQVKDLSLRLDVMEQEKYKQSIKLEATQNQLDNQVLAAQLLTEQNKRLSRENKELRQALELKRGED